jgi:hypothetical protein
MGDGRWAVETYAERAAMRARTGADAFAYSHRARQTGQMIVHQTLNPNGLNFRESRDNAEHPASNAILISLDVTGSMGRVVRGIHANLPQLHELLLGHKYISDPQICFAAVGDATCDRVPLQVGQFESDNRMDQNLENMILEGGGGGHTALDCWEKRQRKGYLFIIGDELAYPAVSAAEVTRLIGPELQADLPLAEAVAEAMQKYHIYFIVPGGASHGHDPKILAFWEKTLGASRVITLQDPDQTSECIALTIGMNEGAIDMSGAKNQLEQRGVVARTVESILSALSHLFGAGKSDPNRDRRL